MAGETFNKGNAVAEFFFATPIGIGPRTWENERLCFVDERDRQGAPACGRNFGTRAATAPDESCEAVKTREAQIEEQERSRAATPFVPSDARGCDAGAASVRPRVGCYLLPRPTDLLAADPFWVFTDVKLESFADLAETPATGTTPEQAASEKAVTRPSVSVGILGYPRPLISDRLLVGFFGSVGSMVGDPPKKDSSGGDRLFWEAGLQFQSRYRISPLDQASVKSVLGQASFSFRKLLYLRCTTVSTSTCSDESSRFIADFRLSYAPLTTKSTTPYVFLTVDRSLSGEHKLQRDRVGFAVEVRLQDAFKAVLPASGNTEAQK